MLSDKAAVYQDDANLEGLRRSAPVIFSLPGQMYDYDDSRSRNLMTIDPGSIKTGSVTAPIDADGQSPICPWWLHEFNRPFEHWNVLHRVNWSEKPAPGTTVKFSDLGMDPTKSYLVYEFWSHKFLGPFTGSIDLPALEPMGLASYAIREQLNRPQIVSTNRHISQGGVDLLDERWSGDSLEGKSQVVEGDPYEMVIHLPKGFAVETAEFGGKPTEIHSENDLARVTFNPQSPGAVKWKITFRKL
jgi:hypothetical protein